MVKIIIDFPVGAYSQNKDKIKEIFKILDYKYNHGRQVDSNKLVCVWKRQPEKQNIIGVFNGSGKECQFQIECNEDEIKVFHSLAQSYNGTIAGSIIKNNVEDAVAIATKKVEQWFTIPKREYGEPDVFYNSRLQKAKVSYDWFISQEVKRMQGLI